LIPVAIFTLLLQVARHSPAVPESAAARQHRTNIHENLVPGSHNIVK
jgi:hypothetical protein